jgi:hypothetical protein
MKTVTNSLDKTILVLDDSFGFNELSCILQAMQLANARITEIINSAEKELDSVTADAFKSVRRNQEAIIRKIKMINAGIVDLDINPYILGTDLTTLRGWL